MARVTIHANCGDAPKRVLLRDLTVAFANAESDGIRAHRVQVEARALGGGGSAWESNPPRTATRPHNGF